MAHPNTRDELIGIANSNNGDPLGFLEGLSPIHTGWHAPVRTYGFLLFHHRVVRYFKAIVNPQVNPPVVPFTDADFQGMQIVPFGGAPQNVGSLSDLQTFSADVEGWHNGAHAGIQVATGVPMMDAAENIFYRVFWQLHFFIDDRFKEALARYEQAVHQDAFLSVSAIAAHIEVRHHSVVPMI